MTETPAGIHDCNKSSATANILVQVEEMCDKILKKIQYMNLK